MPGPANSLNITQPGVVVFDGVSVFTGVTLTAGTGITITNGSGIGGNPTISLAAGGVAVEKLTGNSGIVAVADGANNINVVGAGSITFVGTANTLTGQVTGLTNHSVLVGAGTSTITKVAPSATSGVPLISQGAAADPVFGTAVVAGGGTGIVTTTAYGTLTGGTTATGNFQNAGTGTAGQIYVSNGSAALPQWTNLTSGTVNNLGISYSGGTFTLTDAKGATLSASNFGTVTFQDATNIGRVITMQITNPYTFTDSAGTNELGASLFGITTGVAWANDIPFYLYAVIASAQNDVAFGIGRVPHLTVSPAAGNLGKSGTTLASTQGSLYLLKENGSAPTVASFASSPCVCVGSFRMQATSTPAWTVQTLSATKDGIGNFNEQIAFTMPLGQHGAASGSHFCANGGTAPIFTTNTYTYFVKKNGVCNVNILDTGDGGTDGSGAVDCQFVLPFALDANSGSAYGCWYIVSAAVNQAIVARINGSAITTGSFDIVSNTATKVTNGSFSNGGRTVEASFTYQIDQA